MLSVIGGLWMVAGSAPLAAQTAGRSISPATVVPGGEVTVTIVAADYGGFGAVTETLPAGFAYVSNSGADAAAVTGQDVRFSLLGSDKTFSYVVTASSTEGTYSFSGSLTDDNRGDSTVGGDTVVTVDATPGPRRS